MNKKLNKFLCKYFDEPTTEFKVEYEPIIDKEGNPKKDGEDRPLYIKGYVTGWNVISVVTVNTIGVAFVTIVLYGLIAALGALSNAVIPVPNANEGILFHEAIRGGQIIVTSVIGLFIIFKTFDVINKILNTKIAECPIIKQKTTALELYEKQLEENLK